MLSVNVQKILKDNEEYNKICLEYFKKGENIPQEVKERFLSKKEREKLLRAMTNDEIDYLIEQSKSNQAKAYYKKFRKNEGRQINFDTFGNTQEQEIMVACATN